MPSHWRLVAAIGVLVAGCSHPPAIGGPAPAVYYPDPGEAWVRVRPAEAGVDSLALAAAVQFAQASEIDFSLDMKEQLARNTAREP